MAMQQNMGLRGYCSEGTESTGAGGWLRMSAHTQSHVGTHTTA